MATTRNPPAQRPSGQSTRQSARKSCTIAGRWAAASSHRPRRMGGAGDERRARPQRLASPRCRTAAHDVACWFYRVGAWRRVYSGYIGNVHGRSRLARQTLRRGRPRIRLQPYIRTLLKPLSRPLSLMEFAGRGPIGLSSSRLLLPIGFARPRSHLARHHFEFADAIVKWCSPRGLGLEGRLCQAA